MTNPIDEIKNKLDIVEVVGSYLKLKKAGANYQAICPFHSEKKPSFFVSPSRQIWKCFGCGAGGDVFGFIKQIEGVEFGDALRILAKKAGVELRSVRPELRTERQRLYQICELACQFFEKQLQDSNTGQEVKKYLLGRGINEDSQRTWRLGYSPGPPAGGWRSLSDFLVNKGYKREEIVRAGLAIRGERGTPYDRFRTRITFPLFDLNSQVIGFTGRILEGKEKGAGKYMNTPSTLLYNKSNILYGIDRAKVEIRKNDNCILVEGNVDVILSHQSGINNVAATCGTALTPYQLNILKRYSDNLTLAFDMDVAGDTATKRGIDLAQTKGFNIKVAILPDGKDPADVISQEPAVWSKILGQAQSILDFYFNTTLAKFDRTAVDSKQKIAKILLPVIKQIPNQIVRAHWIQRLSQELNVSEEDIKVEMAKTKLAPAPFEKLGTEKVVSNKIGIRPQGREQLLEKRLIVLIFKEPKNLQILGESEQQFLSKLMIEDLELLKKCELDFNKIKQELPIETFKKFQFLALEAEIEESMIGTDWQKEFAGCFQQIKHLKIKKQLKQLSEQIKQAEREKDLEKTKGLAQQFNELAQQLQ